MHAMMSDRTSRERATMPGPDPGFTMNCAAYVAEREARRVLNVAEASAGHIGRWPRAWHDSLAPATGDASERTVLRKALVESLSAFLSAPDPAAYLARKAQAAKVRESILRVAAGFESHA